MQRPTPRQGASLDLVGASSFMWRQQHVAGHHVWTNVHGLDPDIRVSDADVRRVTPFQPRHGYQARRPRWAQPALHLLVAHGPASHCGSPSTLLRY